MSRAEQLRYCPDGNHMQPASVFRVLHKRAGGQLVRARACMGCEKRKAAPMLGVDIDAIHYKLGAVRKR